MKTLTMMILVALALVGCGGCDESASKEAKPERMRVEWLADGSYRLTWRFDLVDGFDGLVDEKTLDASTTHGRIDHTVEYFAGTRANGEAFAYIEDVHRFPVSFLPGLILTGVLYGANVTGANLDDKRFAVLPGNADGSFLTNVDPLFPFALSPEFYAQYPIAGEITRDDRPNAIHYCTEAKADGLLVTWDGVDHWFPKP
jgi:hypothetical protein